MNHNEKLMRIGAKALQDKSSISESEAKFNSVIEKYGEFLRNSIAKFCPKNLGIHFDDIEQEARLRLWQALQSKKEIYDLASYIYRITVTTTIDAVRRVKSKREDQLCFAEKEEDPAMRPPVASPDESPDRVAELRQLMREVEAALARLSQDRRRAAGLHLEGLNSQEIADLLGWSEPRARNLVYRGLSDLRRQLRASAIPIRSSDEEKNRSPLPFSTSYSSLRL